mmetsp:Transcript_37419/g.94433  ORF Transcript_37419/g.94433 Transcript_37419/m.94433 type:complete len:282 (-) Transcript_37419:269-1114(-)
MGLTFTSTKLGLEDEEVGLLDTKRGVEEADAWLLLAVALLAALSLHGLVLRLLLAAFVPAAAAEPERPACGCALWRQAHAGGPYRGCPQPHCSSNLTRTSLVSALVKLNLEPSQGWHTLSTLISVGLFLVARPSFSCAMKPQLPGSTRVGQALTSYRMSPASDLRCHSDSMVAVSALRLGSGCRWELCMGVLAAEGEAEVEVEVACGWNRRAASDSAVHADSCWYGPNSSGRLHACCRPSQSSLSSSPCRSLELELVEEHSSSTQSTLLPLKPARPLWGHG